MEDYQKTLVSVIILLSIASTSVPILSAGDDMNIIIGILGEPKNLEAKRETNTLVMLSWIKGINSETTIILRKEGSYPSSISDGITIYNGTGTQFTDSVPFEKHYFYRAWSYLKGVYSEKYSQTNIVLGKKVYAKKPAFVPPVLPEKINLEELKIPCYFIFLLIALLLVLFLYMREEDKEKEEPDKPKTKKKNNRFLAFFKRKKEDDEDDVAEE